MKHQSWRRQANRRERVQGKAQESETQKFAYPGIPSKHKTGSHEEDLRQTHSANVYAVAVSVSSYEFCCVDLEDLVFSVSPIFSDSSIPSTFRSPWFHDPFREGFDRDVPFRVDCSKVPYSLHNVCLDFCICYHLLQEEALLMMAE